MNAERRMELLDLLDKATRSALAYAKLNARLVAAMEPLCVEYERERDAPGGTADPEIRVAAVKFHAALEAL